jgi:excinuclease ABC subunit C
MVESNAEIALSRKEEQKVNPRIKLAELAHLDTAPYRIEAYDISHTSGSDTVASMITFENEKPLKSAYRKFKIKEAAENDDTGAMYEVLSRRLKHVAVSEIEHDADEGFAKLPDLILADGGINQVNAVNKALTEYDLNIPVCGMVKNSSHRTRGLVLSNGSEIELAGYPELLNFISQIQDEVHRFAITYHKNVRKRETLKSVFDEIEGIGEKRKKALLKHFGSIKNIKNASIEEIKSVNGMNQKSAKTVKEYFEDSKY